ncbi:MAG: helix-turn-helix domain-containing protein, partial [Acutalibacteraceae bacterium]
MSSIINPELKIKEVAQRIRALRESVGLTPEEAAAKTDVSTEEYLAYESGSKDFSFTFIYKLANAMGVEITDIMEGESPKIDSYDLIRKGEGLPIARRKGLVYQRLAPNFKNKIGEPFLVTIPYVDESTRKPHPSTHSGQEFDIVIKGTLKVKIGDNEDVLHEGDSIYYDSSEEHDVWAGDGEECVIYAMVLGTDKRSKIHTKTVESPAVTN